MEGRILDAQFEKAFPARLPKRIFGTCRRLFLSAENQRQHRQNQEADKQNFGNACRTACDAAETQYGCNDGDNEENDCVMKHDFFPIDCLSKNAAGKRPHFLISDGNR